MLLVDKKDQLLLAGERVKRRTIERSQVVSMLVVDGFLFGLYDVVSWRGIEG